METVNVLKVRDKDEDQEALAIIRSVNGFIALTLSLEHGSDTQVVFTPAECNALINQLQHAVAETTFEYSNEGKEYSREELAEINSTGGILVGAEHC